MLSPVLDSGLDTPFGCVDGLRGLVGVSRGNLQTSRVELLLMFLHQVFSISRNFASPTVERNAARASLNVSPKLVVIVQHENRARGRLATTFPDSPLKIAYG